MKYAKECPFCGAENEGMAIIFHVCHDRLDGKSRKNTGQFVRTRLKANDKIYSGDVFLPEDFRLSDLMNNGRGFIVLANAVEKRQTEDVPVGSIALNKNMIEWIELKTVKEEERSDYQAKLSIVPHD